MLSKELEKALNDQVNKEYYSAFIYLSMSAYFDSKSLIGMANWMKMQYEEEVAHAERIFSMILDMEGEIA